MNMVNETQTTGLKKRRLNIRMVEERLCWHRQTIWRKYKAGKFPLPHFLGQNRVWWEHEIEQWEEEQMSCRASINEASRNASSKQIAQPTSADSFYTKSGSSPPNVTNIEEGKK